MGDAEPRPRVQHPPLDLERFRAWRRSGDIEIRNAIVADAKGIAIGMARRFRDRGVELDDLIQVAQIGLLNAVERFDPERGIPFLSFATPTVLGELRRHFRTVWSVRVPRGLQEASLRVGPALLELQQELQRTPTVSEVATRLGCTTDDVLEAMEASSAFRAASLDAPVGRELDPRAGRSMTQMPAPAAEAAFDIVDARNTVERLLPELSERTRRIVELRFFEELSQAEIAERVGVSQMHVSRLLRQALDQMAKLVKESTDDGRP